jgi:GxxExxY protein
MSQPSKVSRHSFEALSRKVIAACIDVQRQLGVHCREIDYQRALALALPKQNVMFQREVEIPIAYDGVMVTRRRVDFVIWDAEAELILETKAISQIRPEDVEQCLLYLRQGNYKVCLLINFGQKPLGIRRFVHTPQATQKRIPISPTKKPSLDAIMRGADITYFIFHQKGDSHESRHFTRRQNPHDHRGR